MTVAQFGVGLVRLAGIVLPAAVVARLLRRRYVSADGPLGVLTEVVFASSVLLVVAEALGLVGLMRLAVLIPALVLLACALWKLSGDGAASSARSAQLDAAESARPGHDLELAGMFVSVVVVAAQWCVQTANALGAGMANFDTLWYHMPFAAHIAQTGSVTGIQFTQADPYVAYYPANSELVHALGIEAMGSDFLSPLLNLAWLAVALLAAWCLGRPWRVERLTLIAGCLVLSLPVLSATQPGEGYNDAIGVAMLLAAAAFVVNAKAEPVLAVAAGLALGIAVGTKFTFVVPALVLAAGVFVCASTGTRKWQLAALAVPMAMTGAWWYLRNLIAVGNPEGLRLHLGPLTLPGPPSPLESASQQTVISQVSHLSLWGSRFAPGLEHAFGPLWPLVLAVCVATVAAGIIVVRDPVVRVLALTAAATGIAYLFLPTGASAIDQGSTLFQVNLRYVTPALALGIVLVPILLRLHAPRLLGMVAPGFVVVTLTAQLAPSLWPTQPARHIAALAVAAGIATVVAVGVWAMRNRPRPTLAIAALAFVLLGAVAGFIVQRHYFSRRYLTADKTDPAFGAIYAWAQHIAHARIALYGNVQQYPLYGARDTNQVDYLGTHTDNGGFRPIATCEAWRSAVNEGHSRYVVLTPAPTAEIPIAWTQDDPAAHLILSPAANATVFEITGQLDPGHCKAPPPASQPNTAGG